MPSLANCSAVPEEHTEAEKRRESFYFGFCTISWKNIFSSNVHQCNIAFGQGMLCTYKFVLKQF